MLSNPLIPALSRRRPLIEHSVLVSADSIYVQDTYKERVQLIGPTLAGRMLTVIVGSVPHRPACYYVVSARRASRKERQYYRKQKGGLPE